MMDLQAAIGIHQLKRVDEWLKRRNEIWQMYQSAFINLPVELPPDDEPNTVHARHLYTLMVDKEKAGINRDDFMQELHLKNIGTGVHYLGVHLHPYYQDTYGYKPSDFPNATWFSERTVSLPLSAKLSNQDVEDIISAIHDVIPS